MLAKGTGALSAFQAIWDQCMVEPWRLVYFAKCAMCSSMVGLVDLYSVYQLFDIVSFWLCSGHVQRTKAQIVNSSGVFIRSRLMTRGA